eukprot:scaffold14722_cov32-Tisochrysis_lutea.AAC.2
MEWQMRRQFCGKPEDDSRYEQRPSDDRRRPVSRAESVEGWNQRRAASELSDARARWLVACSGGLAHLCSIISVPFVSAFVPREVGPSVNCAFLTVTMHAANDAAPSQCTMASWGE